MWMQRQLLAGLRTGAIGSGVVLTIVVSFEGEVVSAASAFTELNILFRNLCQFQKCKIVDIGTQVGAPHGVLGRRAF